MRFVHVRLQAPEHRVSELARFYGTELGLRPTSFTAPAVFQIGETAFELSPGVGGPFYHFALLVPGNRFEAALAWARSHVRLLTDPRSGDVAFDFDFWDAKACYFQDPAGNIVELIAHRGVAETGADGDFQAAELAGLSELGLVGDLQAMAGSLAGLGLDVWDGSVDPPGGLAFVGERARTLILAPIGRGWLPIGRAAEVHDVEVLVSGEPRGEVLLEGGRYRVRRTGR
jgi:catechol 2,3-dioxygenase-like lactoylglutathione lyase family enzyme